MKQELPLLQFASQQDWEQWLDAHHATSKGLWLKIAKKGAGTTTVSFPEALESALCYGWIDGQKASQTSNSGHSASRLVVGRVSGRA